jgi:hypothetical protein
MSARSVQAGQTSLPDAKPTDLRNGSLLLEEATIIPEGHHDTLLSWYGCHAESFELPAEGYRGSIG